MNKMKAVSMTGGLVLPLSEWKIWEEMDQVNQ